MAEKFLKLMDSEETEFLITKYPNAFLLLTVIARRAKRKANNPDGLGIGECYVGDHKSCGLSRQNYRTALKVLEQRLTIKILETCRTRKKSTTGSTTGSTTVGTKVRLLRSDIYDINPEDANHQTNDRPNHRLTTDQPPPNHEQEREEGKEIKETITSPNPLLSKNVGLFGFDDAFLKKLKSESIKDDQIQKLRKWSQAEVQEALDWSLANVPADNLKQPRVANVTWYLKQPNKPVNKEKNMQINRQTARAIKEKYSESIKNKHFERINNILEIGKTEQFFTEVNLYDSPTAFNNQLESAMRKADMFD